ncbi:MAG: hypothetical protein E7280_06060 [Lachnospiraceae bacterium]|nr:hypothetical protein [Lachnospiraceae bacterium]
MKIANNMGGIQFQYVKNTTGKKQKWKMTEELTDKVKMLAKQDAYSDNPVYMGEGYLKLLDGERAKVAPNRELIKSKVTMMLNQVRTEQDCENEEEELDLLSLLLGLPYTAKVDGISFGKCIHIFDENGDEILCYTPTSGWHEWPTKEEQVLDQVMTKTYYMEYCEARQEYKRMCKDEKVEGAETGCLLKDTVFLRKREVILETYYWAGNQREMAEKSLTQVVG